MFSMRNISNMVAAMQCNCDSLSFFMSSDHSRWYHTSNGNIHVLQGIFMELP